MHEARDAIGQRLTFEYLHNLFIHERLACDLHPRTSRSFCCGYHIISYQYRASQQLLPPQKLKEDGNHEAAVQEGYLSSYNENKYVLWKTVVKHPGKSKQTTSSTLLGNKSSTAQVYSIQCLNWLNRDVQGASYCVYSREDLPPRRVPNVKA